ncbi:MAG: hypothetical protein LBL71_01950 [Endomicrobium sp.]|nr:hypothetical protein [Endomicrobium sp.]
MITILHDLFLEFFGTLILYYFVEYKPEQHEKAIIKRRLKAAYLSMKSNIMLQILIIANMQQYNKCIDILINNSDAFYELFSGGNWDNFFYALEQHSEYSMEPFFREVEIFDNEINSTMLLYPAKDEKTYNFFKNLHIELLNLIRVDCESYEDRKYFVRSLWALFTHWDFCSWQHDDYIKKYIDNL